MKKIILLLFTIFSLESVAQTYQENLEKYWYYRHRLKTEWMYNSEHYQQGDVCVPENIAIHEDCIGGFDLSYLRTGDQTWLLGHYLGVLATEYKLLKDNGQDVSEVLRDIDFALGTLERLDFTGELCFGVSLDRNGFFIRDDVPQGFQANFPDFDDIKSDYIDICPSTSGGNEMSQDQVWGLFIGLRLLKEFVDVYDYNISWRVVNNTDLIINAMHFTDWLGAEEWVILNPVTGNPVSAGANCKALSWAFAKVAKDITGTNQQTPTSILWKPVFEGSQATVLNQFPTSPPSCFDCSKEGNKEFSAKVGEDIRSPFNAYGILTLTALTNHNVSPNFLDAYHYLQWVNIATRQGGGYYNMLLGLYPHLIALNKILYNNISPNIGPRFYEFFLNSAPPCGAYHYRDTIGNHLNSEPPWHTMSLFSPQHCCATDNVNRGHTNMVDYMLLYNLYFINYLEGEYPYKEIRNDFPSSSYNYDRTTQKENEIIVASRQLDIYSNIYPPADVTFIAGEKIRFLPGFHAYNNSHVLAYIEPTLLDDIYYKETYTDVCNGQESICESLSKTYFKNINDKNVDSQNNKIKLVNFINDDNDKDEFVSVYPNPSTNLLKIESSNLIINKIIIQSMDGRVMISKKNNSKTLDLKIDTFKPGIYFLKIDCNNEKYVTKIIKQ